MGSLPIAAIARRCAGANGSRARRPVAPMATQWRAGYARCTTIGGASTASSAATASGPTGASLARLLTAADSPPARDSATSTISAGSLTEIRRKSLSVNTGQGRSRGTATRRSPMFSSIGASTPLHTDESIHHKNGVRSDNRLENLELWSRSQPSGQRVEDKIAWALEFLAQYAPHMLR